MSNLLPANASALELALMAFIERKLTALEIPIRQLWNPFLCPLELLPWLAWTVSVDEWDSAWSEEQKRQTVADSFKTHGKKGTKLGVAQRLASLGYSANIIEWFEDPDNMPPFTFLVDIDPQDKPINSTIFGTAKQLIDSAKNTRSHLTRLRFSVENTAKINVLSGIYAGAYLAVGGPLAPIPTPVEPEEVPEPILGWNPLPENLVGGTPSLYVTHRKVTNDGGSVWLSMRSNGTTARSINSALAWTDGVLRFGLPSLSLSNYPVDFPLSINASGLGFAAQQDGHTTKTEDGGASWVAAAQFIDSFSTAATTCLKVSSTGTVLQFNNASMRRSTNGGGTWSESIPRNPFPYLMGNALALDTNNAGVWIVGGTGATSSVSDKRLMRSTDDGVTWGAVTQENALSSTAAIYSVKHVGGSVWLALVLHANYVFRSTDDGASWVRVTLPKSSQIGIAADGSGNCMTYGLIGWACHSTNFGGAWLDVSGDILDYDNGDENPYNDTARDIDNMAANSAGVFVAVGRHYSSATPANSRNENGGIT